MAIIFVQKDTAATCTEAAFCSGLGASPGWTAIEQFASQGGAAGSTEDLTGNQSNPDATIYREVYYDIQIPSGMFGETGDSGDWTVRVNHTTGASDIDLDEIHICRVNSSCASQETLGSSTGIAFATDGGVFSGTVSQASGTSITADDRVMIVIAYQSNGAHGNAAFGVTPDQNIDCPWTVPAGAGPVAGLRTLALSGVGV